MEDMLLDNLAKESTEASSASSQTASKGTLRISRIALGRMSGRAKKKKIHRNTKINNLAERKGRRGL